MTDLIFSTANEVVGLLRKGEVSPHELLDVLEDRIKSVDSQVNALPTLCFEKARTQADRILKMPMTERGLLCGLPLPIKDLSKVAGVRTTFGSSIFENDVPDVNDYCVDRIESNGGIVYAKSNTPEFGAGGNTFNDVFGATRNPHDLSKSAAGSSGGAAASLASGTSWLAQGSDQAGSLRSPASFCGVVGMRPSPGRVPRGIASNPFQHLSVDGPMARNVEDLALLFDAMVGEDKRDPMSLPHHGESYLTAARQRVLPKKVAFSPNMGISPVDPEVAKICEQAALKFENAGIPVVRAEPDFKGMKKHYRVLRAYNFASMLSQHAKNPSNKFKPELLDEIRTGEALTCSQLMEANKAIGEYRLRALEFFSEYDLLLTPTTIVPPFPIEQRYVSNCADTTFENYLDWLAIAYVFTFVSLPALSLTCGFTKEKLPVGLQMVGPHRSEAKLLSYALALEEMLGIDKNPITPVS